MKNKLLIALLFTYSFFELHCADVSQAGSAASSGYEGGSENEQPTQSPPPAAGPAEESQSQIIDESFPLGEEIPPKERTISFGKGKRRAISSSRHPAQMAVMHGSRVKPPSERKRKSERRKARGNLPRAPKKLIPLPNIKKAGLSKEQLGAYYKRYENCVKRLELLEKTQGLTKAQQRNLIRYQEEVAKGSQLALEKAA